MNNTLHTPAPWSVKKDSPQAGIIIAQNRNLGIAEVFGGGETDIANARLIAAAPDLLSALEFLLADYIAINGEKLTGSSFPADKAREALRKAKGKA
jgi:hypothetical protein